MEYRFEKDTMGEVRVPFDVYWGAQTERSRSNFKIGPQASMPFEIIDAYSILKKAAAYTNYDFGILPAEKRDAITRVCDEIHAKKLNEHFPLVIWQTGSGTQTNMNVNEVIANRAQVLAGLSISDREKVLQPNDDVNMSQSSNDTFPTAMHIAAYSKLVNSTIPAIEQLRESFAQLSVKFYTVVKIGRTHLMDATPLTFGQEFSGYAAQLDYGLHALTNTLRHLSHLALGGTAVGTGINAPEGYSEKVAKYIADFTGLPFTSAPNKFEALAAQDALVESHGALKQLAVSLYKIGNDLRLLSSGPRSGIGELILPSNEPGSSIMPGKVNPTQIEALTMVCARVIGNDATITFAGSQGHFELNVFKPVMISAFLESAQLLGDACRSFNDLCVKGIQVNEKRVNELLNKSLMLVTALTPKIGYYKSAEIANAAHMNGTTLKEESVSLGYLTAEEYDKWVDPSKMV